MKAKVRRRPREVVSAYMAAIRSRGTGPEALLRRKLRSLGLCPRAHYAALPGTPDFAFPGERLAVFVDGCFWHICPKCYTAPSVSTRYWKLKAGRNLRRDRRNECQIRALGWSVVRIRECALERDSAACATRVLRALRRRPTRGADGPGVDSG